MLAGMMRDVVYCYSLAVEKFFVVGRFAILLSAIIFFLDSLKLAGCVCMLTITSVPKKKTKLVYKFLKGRQDLTYIFFIL